jgi:two-component system, sensor histidine kinase LadS
MHRIKRFPIFITVFFIFISLSSFSQADNNDVFYIYEDSAKKLTGETAYQLYLQGKFTKTEKNNLNKGFTRSIFWLAYKSEQQKPADSLLLYIGHHHINRIHFFFAKDSSVYEQYTTGDYYPFRQRPIKATGFYFPINKEGIYLAQIDKSNESLQLSFNLLSKVDAISTEADNKIIMAVFTGMILLLIIFGIYLFLISKDRIYIFYILYISVGWLWVLANAGYGFQYLWPNLPWFASKARPVFALAPLIFSMLFLVRYIGGLRSKKVLRTVQVLNVFLAASILTILLVDEKGYQTKLWLYIQYLIPLISISYAVITLSILTAASIKGNKLAMFYLVAILVLLASAILQSSFSFGGFNSFSHLLSNFGLAFGYVIEAIILTAGLVYRFNQYRVEKEKLLLEMNKRQQENTRILMEVQEAERSQVANQLHDVAGSLLSAAKLNLSSLREKGIMNMEAASHAQKAEEAVGLVSDMVRNLSHALSPVMLEKVGFKTSIEKVIAIVNASGKINIQLIVLGFEKYIPALNNYYTALYSIAYELLNNIIKHSGAKNVLVQVAEHEDCFSLLAEDDGVGFDTKQLKENESFGLAGIQSKIDYLKGLIAFDNNKPQGLIVTIEIPVTQHDV